MIREKREITVKIIRNKNINIDRLANFFAKKYSIGKINNKNIKS